MKRGAATIVPDYDLLMSSHEIFCHVNNILGKDCSPIGNAECNFNINATFQSFRNKTY